MCLYPRLIRNPKYLPNKKNGGVVATPQDPRVISVPIGCGQCIECRKKKYNEWKTRLLEEVKKKQTGIFVTLTFNQEKWNYYYDKAIGIGYQKENNMAIMAVKDFMNRWRNLS